MEGFYTSISRVVTYIMVDLIPSVGAMIRESPILLFTLGFVALGYTIVVFGRLLSRD